MAAVGGKGALRWAAVLGYAAFALAVFVVALVLTFPVRPAVERLTAVAAARTGWAVEVTAPRWSFPAGLAARGLTGSGPKGETVALRDVRVSFSPLGLKDGALVLDHDVHGYGGRSTGHLEVEDAFSTPAYRWQGEVRDLSLAELPPPPPDVPLSDWAQGYRMEGRLDLTAQAGWRAGEAERGQGDGTLSVTGLSVTLPRTPMGELVLPFGEVRGEARWQRGRVELNGVTIDGAVVRGRGSGAILLGHTPRVSRLDLRFTGTLEDGFPMREMVTALLGLQGAEVTITIKGTVARPLLFVNGKSVDRMMQGG